MEAAITATEPAKEPKKRKTGALGWCKKCSRKHGSRENCLQIAVPTRSNAGNTVTRFIHVSRLQGE